MNQEFQIETLDTFCQKLKIKDWCTLIRCRHNSETLLCLLLINVHQSSVKILKFFKQKLTLSYLRDPFPRLQFWKFEIPCGRNRLYYSYLSYKRVFLLIRFKEKKSILPTDLHVCNSTAGWVDFTSYPFIQAYLFIREVRTCLAYALEPSLIITFLILFQVKYCFRSFTTTTRRNR